jgi:hypothetical protein
LPATRRVRLRTSRVTTQVRSRRNFLGCNCLIESGF